MSREWRSVPPELPAVPLRGCWTRLGRRSGDGRRCGPAGAPTARPGWHTTLSRRDLVNWSPPSPSSLLLSESRQSRLDRSAVLPEPDGPGADRSPQGPRPPRCRERPPLPVRPDRRPSQQLEVLGRLPVCQVLGQRGEGPVLAVPPVRVLAPQSRTPPAKAPSTVPPTVPPGASTNVSTPTPSVRFSMPEKLMPAAMQLLGPVMTQMLLAAGPVRLSVAEPPCQTSKPCSASWLHGPR